MMDHPSDPCDLIITANHRGPLSVTVMIGKDPGQQYSDDGWRLMPGPDRGWTRLNRAGTQCLLTALVGWVDVNIFIIMKWGYLTLEYVGALGSLTLMFKVTPLRETPTHWLTILPDDMLILVTLDWAGWLPRLLKDRMMNSAARIRRLWAYLHVFNLKFMLMLPSVIKQRQSQAVINAALYMQRFASVTQYRESKQCKYSLIQRHFMYSSIGPGSVLYLFLTNAGSMFGLGFG